jgi:hypothetical protein
MKRLKTILALFGLAVLVAALYALRFSHFVPSATWVQISLYAALCCAMCGALFALLPPHLIRRTWLAKKSITIPISALLSFAAGYEAFAAGFPAWYTSVAGSPGQQIVTIEKWRPPTFVKTCGGPDLVEAPLVQTVCLRVKRGANVPPGTKLLLKGSTTSLGINVASIRLAPRH